MPADLNDNRHDPVQIHGFKFLYFCCETMIICRAYQMGEGGKCHHVGGGLKAKIRAMLSYRGTLDKN